MATKTCPNCGAEVPTVAKLCRDCFHDFTVVKPPNNGPLILLGLITAMSVLGALTLGWISSVPTDERIQVNGETRTVNFVRQYTTGVKTEKIPFDQITALEHVVDGGGIFRVIAIQADGTRVPLKVSRERSQKTITEKWAELMGKPWTEVDNTSGFVKQAQQNLQQQDAGGQ